MALNPGGNGNYNWNYSNETRDGFSLELWGTVVSIQEVQGREFSMNGQPGRPAFWPDGNPKMNIRIGLATPDGSLKSVTFAKAGKKQVAGEKPSLHMQLYAISNGNMPNIVGKTIHMVTWPVHPGEHQLLGYKEDIHGNVYPNPWNTDNLKGQAWGRGNPRLFGVEEVADTKYELAMPLPEEFKVPALYANDGVAGGQPVAPAPQQMQQVQAPPMQGQYFAPPMVQQQPMQQQPYPYNMQQPAQFQPRPMQPQPQMPQQPMPAVQAMPPMTAPMPQGMDPAVMAAMQAAGAVNVQPVENAGSVYDESIPF